MKTLNSFPKLISTVKFANKFSNCEFFDGILHRRQNPIIATVWPWQILQLLSNLLCFVRCYLMAKEVMWFSNRGRHPTVAAQSGRCYGRRQWRRHWDSTRGSVGVKPLGQLQPKPFGSKEEDEPPHMTAFCRRRLRQQLHLRQKAALFDVRIVSKHTSGDESFMFQIQLFRLSYSSSPAKNSSAVAASTKTPDHGRSDVAAASWLIHELF
ncbi:hypothetical protein RHSIM_Rhsim09G0054800 [Rhododendron simsii]|uniref:Uncharacterized protein n=1 Tax=Rhododendron simsii TaxID=118357 RepID=A0A834LDA9_RHOSS|nr:hypothetical protein RHSIM_Rhsim09G0054800 [Rhododendron simsii]